MQLQGQNIFILGLAKFNNKIESTIFTLAKHLAASNRVFYIENPFTWKEMLKARNKTDVSYRKEYFPFAADKVIDTQVPNLKVVVTPPLISINWLPESRIYRAILKVNERIILHRIRQIIRKFKIKNYLFINSFNFYYPDLGKLLSPNLSVYHCVDPLVFDVDRKHGLVSERQVVADSNLVICTSKRLYDEKIKINDNTFFVPNAADISHSSKALDVNLRVHECLDGIKGPIVGYFGHIERRFDYELLDQLTQRHADLSFVFTGPVSPDQVPRWFYDRKNIYLTGPIPYDQMPNVLKGFDTAIIPFKKDAFSATIFPLKLFEYLGSGKPVVATDFNADLAEFTAGTVPYCGDVISFSDALMQSIYGDTDELMQRRLAVARENTWERRADEFGSLLHAHIAPGVNTELITITDHHQTQAI